MAGKKVLRYSVPPYGVPTVCCGVPLFNPPGDCWKIVERQLQPSLDELRGTLIDVRAKLHWSRQMLAAFLGVSSNVLRKWENGQRNPSGAARRLIWLLWILVFRPATLESGLDFIVWGKGDELRELGRQLRVSAEASVES